MDTHTFIYLSWSIILLSAEMHFIFSFSSGTGKTLLARAVASQLDCNFLKVTSSSPTLGFWTVWWRNCGFWTVWLKELWFLNGLVKELWFLNGLVKELWFLNGLVKGTVVSELCWSDAGGVQLHCGQVHRRKCQAHQGDVQLCQGSPALHHLHGWDWCHW